jgi:hypothetical protein
MVELELVGLHDDGERLVLRAPDGRSFTLPINDSLRAAARRDRPQFEQLRTEGLSPREIQARIRAGATAQEVAESVGVPVEQVRRYEGPVLAEREYIAEQARTARIGREAGAPVLGDLVADRLAARGVGVESLVWDAARDTSGQWTVTARFDVNGDRRAARWTFDPTTKAVEAQEDEARWLSETELDEAQSKRHLAAVRDVVFDIQRAEQVQQARSMAKTADLLDELESRRGRRQPVDIDADDFDELGPTSTFDLTTAPEPLEPPAVSEPVETVAETSTQTDEHPAPRNRRKGRAKVPSWDEIVFGAKPE